MDAAIAARARPSWRLGAPTAAVVMLALTLTLWFLHWRGLDYPAQIYRIGLIRRHGLSFWDANWYGGHYTPAYGVVVPWLASVVGLATLTIASTVVSVLLMHRLLRETSVPHVLAGTVAFGFLMLVNMYEGRLPFACGVLVGLATVLLGRRERWRLAAVAGVLTALASPVAGAFLALAMGAWALAQPRERWSDLLRQPRLWVGLGPLVTTALINVMFLEGGLFPFNIADIIVIVTASVIVFRLPLPPRYTAVRYGFALAGLAAIPLTVIPNPMGGNLTRLAIIGAPILCAFPFTRRRWALQAAVCLVLLVQQAEPLLRLPESLEDPSAHAAYFTPLLDELQSQTDGPVRLEIPMTQHHWEAAYVAPKYPLARGWERQLDLRYNGVLYDEDLTVTEYQDWLDTNGVQFVAVPDVPLDHGALREAQIVSQAPYLEQVWSSEHWRLYRVIGSPGLVTGPATVQRMTADKVRLDVTRPEAILLRMRYTPHLSITRGHGCVSESDEGWTKIFPSTTGPMTLDATLFADQPSWCSVTHP